MESQQLARGRGAAATTTSGISQSNRFEKKMQDAPHMSTYRSVRDDQQNWPHQSEGLEEIDANVDFEGLVCRVFESGWPVGDQL
jgi:hypothetical protein